LRRLVDNQHIRLVIWRVHFERILSFGRFVTRPPWGFWLGFAAARGRAVAITTRIWESNNEISSWLISVRSYYLPSVVRLRIRWKLEAAVSGAWAPPGVKLLIT
jgi:hypothetical protein